MKKFVYASALAIALAGSALIAQEPTSAPAQDNAPAARVHGKHRNPHKMTEKLAADLNLTDDQKAKVEPILADRQQKMAALAADTASTPQVKKQQAREIMKKSNSDLAAVLTPDQVEKMKSMHHGHKGGEAPAAPSNQ